MVQEKKYYKYIDFIRLISCVMVLLYHLNIIKGGYLAVCVFFVLSGYLTCVSCFKKEKFSFTEYYFNKLLKLYLPLLIVVLITISTISFLPNVSWFNLKPEATSVLLGYNNYWQLSVNLDYFARSIISPFTHLWYIAILLQFDLIFPFIYIILRKIGDKTKKYIPCILVGIISVLFTGLFCYASFTTDIMNVYYNTLFRVFSLLFGVFIGFIHMYYKPLIPKFIKNEKFSKLVYWLYIVIIICLCLFIDANSIYFAISMIIVTLISCRLIDYSVNNYNDKFNTFDKVVKNLSKVTYEIYLVQFPVIFLVQYMGIEGLFKILIVVILTILISYIIKFCVEYSKERKYKVLKVFMCILVYGFSLYGMYQYFLAEDHTAEMKNLERELQENERLILQKQEEYINTEKEEKDAWMNTLKDLNDGKEEIKDVVTNARVVGVGDSVMLGAVNDLYKKFPNGYFDAKISRTAWVAGSILQDLKNKNILGDIVIINLGANGDCPTSCKINIMEICKDSEVFWLNVTNDYEVHINNTLNEFAKSYDNLHIIDWNNISKGHNEYFISDNIHLTDKGITAYTNSIYDAIYNLYLEEYNEKKNEIIKNHEIEVNNKISFYGNDALLNVFNYIKDDFKDANFVIDKEFNYDILKEKLQKAKDDGILTHKIAFVFDSNVNISLEEYQKLLELYPSNEIYIFSFNINTKDLSILNSSNVKVINFYNNILENNDYIMVDGVHLTSKGNEEFSKVLKDNLSN